MSQAMRGQDGHLVFPIGQKNTNLVEDDEILLPVKFRWIPFGGFREVENISANQSPGRPSFFYDRPVKSKLGRGSWDLASCQVSLNSIQRFQLRLWSCCTPYQRQWLYNSAPLVAFYDTLGIRRTYSRLLTPGVLTGDQRFQRSRKISQPFRAQGGHFVFTIGPKNTNLEEEVEILLPVKFRWIPLSGFIGEVENVSANQTPGWPSCFSDPPEK